MQILLQRNGLRLTAIALSLTLALPAHAALQDEGNGQLYDNVTGLVWQQNANLAATNTFGVSGIDSYGYMRWSTAKSWVAAMNAANYLGHNDWMLPTVKPINAVQGFNYNYTTTGSADLGWNITSQAAQLSYMYYVNLNLKGYFSPLGLFQSDFGVFGNGSLNGIDSNSYGGNNVGLVRNLQSEGYWSGTFFANSPPNNAWFFNTTDGSQVNNYINIPLSVWAVRAGTAADIAAVAANIPEPESYAMLLAGLGLIGFMARRRKTA